MEEFNWEAFEREFVEHTTNLNLLQAYVNTLLANGEMLKILCEHLDIEFSPETYILSSLTDSFATRASEFYAELIKNPRLLRYLADRLR